jgi:UDP-GlcNAc:undecaprenyl-phosphate/decaprenyl-phosphate GlcNAc-1-phosphate transferase
MSVIFYIIFFISAFLISFFIHRYFLNRSHKYTLKKANVSAERWSTQSKPIFGGITFYAVFMISILIYFVLPGSKFQFEDHFIALILVPTLGFLMGLADDMFNTPPNFKFVVQLIIAAVLIYFGIYIQIFDNIMLNYVLTVFWVVGIMNSINMLDNMDAISSLTTIVALSIVLVNIFLNCKLNLIFFTVVLLGSLSSIYAFLIYNWSPSKMYMGDNGSQFIGTLLAFFGILFLWNVPVIQKNPSELKSFLIVALAFIVPLSDTTTVTINRLMRKQSPFIGGMDHTTHHISKLVFSDRKTAFILLSVSILSGVLAILIANNFLALTKITIPLLILYVLAIFIALYSTTKISKPK